VRAGCTGGRLNAWGWWLDHGVAVAIARGRRAGLGLPGKLESGWRIAAGHGLRIVPALSAHTWAAA
jgi:hypothetical protein